MLDAFAGNCIIVGAGIAGRFALSDRLKGCLILGRAGCFALALGLHAVWPGRGRKCDDCPNQGLAEPAGLRGKPSLNSEAMYDL